ncbi:hypothetical protein BJ165DRAFT_1456869 [Panaeolus papilionaceus]|nr:hypothetical protein BJ165DRAFT_1456869 [Panaeolus papilionaceus]
MLKRVILPNDDGDMLVKLLDSCPNLEDLALWQPRTTFYGDVHKALDTSLSNLKRFSTSHYALLNMCKLFPDSYLNITHLCINSNSIHSAVLSWMIDPAHSLLQVVVALDGPREDWRFEDPRYVYLSGVDEVVEEDWLKGGNGGMDFWEFAERIVIEEGQSWWTERNWTAPGTLSKLKRLSTHYTHIVKEKGVLSDACVNVTHLWLLFGSADHFTTRKQGSSISLLRRMQDLAPSRLLCYLL